MERRRLVDDGEQLELPMESAKPALRRRLVVEEEMVESQYTDWSGGRPPSCGYWEVKQRSGRDTGVVKDWPRMWFSPDGDYWVPHAERASLLPPIPHEVFEQAMQYRGLKMPPPEGYDYSLLATESPDVRPSKKDRPRGKQSKGWELALIAEAILGKRRRRVDL